MTRTIGTCACATALLTGCYGSHFAVPDGDWDVFHPVDDGLSDTRDDGWDEDADLDFEAEDRPGVDARADAAADADSGPPDVGCGSGPELAERSCRAVLDDCGPVPDGRYWLNPSGVVGDAFEVWCDMTLHDGGWALVAELGELAVPSSDFRSDLETSALLDGAPPSATQYSHLDLARFDSYGETWTVRTATDALGDMTHIQYAFFRPKPDVRCSPRVAGSNWRGTTTNELLLHLTMTTTTGLDNTVWLDVPTCELGHCADSMNVLWTYRVEGLDPLRAPCLDGTGQTTICHSIQGAIADSGGLGGHGSMTAAYGMQDGVNHAWGRRTAYWIRDTNLAGTP